MFPLNIIFHYLPVTCICLSFSGDFLVSNYIWVLPFNLSVLNHLHLMHLLLWLGVNLPSHYLFFLCPIYSVAFYKMFFLAFFRLSYILFESSIFSSLLAFGFSSVVGCFAGCSRVCNMHLKPISVYSQIVLCHFMSKLIIWESYIFSRTSFMLLSYISFFIYCEGHAYLFFNQSLFVRQLWGEKIFYLPTYLPFLVLSFFCVDRNSCLLLFSFCLINLS